MKKLGLLIGFIALSFAGISQNTNQSKFKQLGQELPTPNVYRAASGAPGHLYYQQKADYDMDITLLEDENKIEGIEVITYTNNSPDPLNYLWLQLDQNVRAQGSMTRQIKKGRLRAKPSEKELDRYFYNFDGGFKIEEVQATSGKDMEYTINNTMMRVELDEPLKKGEKVSFRVKWWYNINEYTKIGGRSGYESFEEEGNNIYVIAQFFPRMAVYNDHEGWMNKQFLGGGEFTLPFGDYNVNITVPADHVLGATGELQNGNSILSSDQRKRRDEALKSFDQPIMIVTEEEALEAEKGRSKETKTWTFKAKDVRDFAFASSRKFMWDAMAVDINGTTRYAMSYYSKEGNPLWGKYSTRVVAHTIKTYSKYTIDYPYPKAISVHAKWQGMEYPMICFNGGRPESDGTYSESTKYGMLSVIMHEVGHNFFPMIINSDERQWTWMDEGLNTFVQYLTEQEWDVNYPSRRGPADKITDYMKGDKSRIMPIMTNSESIYQFGSNAYGKPATALNILRETVMGRELFDYAFKEYSVRWKFKHPTPADFFRTMEDASAVDLDWFWRGWFFTNDHVDVSMNSVRTINDEGITSTEEAKDHYKNYIGYIRNKNEETVLSQDPTMRDRYDDQRQEDAVEGENSTIDHHFYEIEFENVGGLVMPLILQFELENGENEIVRLPAEIWLKNEIKFSKVFVMPAKVKRVILDPFYEMADTDRSNNFWPSNGEASRFEKFQELD